MPSIPLPENASFEHLKKQAKLVQELVASSDSGAFDLIREFHPRFATASEEATVGFKRSDAQLVVARLYGFASWTKLRDQVGLVNAFTRPDPADVDPDDDVDRLVTLACVSYNGDHDPSARTELARSMLVAHPDLATASIAAITVSGHHRAMTELIEQDPKLVNEPCGPNGWPPLLYCCYSRLDSSDPARSTLATAQVLLDAGADPNAGYLWHGLVPPFTALTGAFGRGEADQAPHHDATELARLLLEAGADPNDGQALYNNGLAGTAHDDASHLQLLVEFGLGTPTDGPWYQRFGTRLTAPDQLLDDELEVAAHRGLPNRMRFLAELGVDLNRPVGRSRQTPWQLANAAGHTAIIDVLIHAGVQGSRPGT
ncbi:MAG: ankyrin repeat domain-containing protein [Ilumatobacter sp.]|uniref:ankyrin repeat domain-containing protein n=1 Tax=Ilumatobacter sp. TaxID=1967498 RepID=UPI00329907BC